MFWKEILTAERKMTHVTYLYTDTLLMCVNNLLAKNDPSLLLQSRLRLHGYYSTTQTRGRSEITESGEKICQERATKGSHVKNQARNHCKNRF